MCENEACTSSTASCFGVSEDHIMVVKYVAGNCKKEELELLNIVMKLKLQLMNKVKGTLHKYIECLHTSYILAAVFNIST